MYSIEQGVLKYELKDDIIVYRNDYAPDDLKGDVKKFLSTSVTRNGVLNRKPNVAIIVPKGSKGAYIENLANPSFKKQREFLLNKNTNLEEVYRDKGFIILKVK